MVNDFPLVCIYFSVHIDAVSENANFFIVLGCSTIGSCSEY
jgi:hypothetical protein